MFRQSIIILLLLAASIHTQDEFEDSTSGDTGHGEDNAGTTMGEGSLTDGDMFTDSTTIRMPMVSTTMRAVEATTMSTHMNSATTMRSEEATTMSTHMSPITTTMRPVEATTMVPQTDRTTMMGSTATTRNVVTSVNATGAGMTTTRMQMTTTKYNHGVALYPCSLIFTFFAFLVLIL